MSGIIRVLLLGVFGIIGGVLGGMGMGGGTLLIPLLTIFLSVNQKLAQSINLLAFLPMSIIALIIHAKNKKIDLKNSLYMIIPAFLFSILGGYLASVIKSKLLRKFFGYFLIALAFLNVIFTIKSNKKGKKKN
ncbi:MAG: sulfite exporter TauE/SafE family protein [Clostridia bacterium]|nr:sulfite exporter TauE/SafE family protein [Clostridia bacterium]